MDILFQGINTKEKTRILKDFHSFTFTFQKGKSVLDKIISENFIGIVLEGSIEIYKENFNANKSIIDVVETGDIFSTIFLPIFEEDYEIISLEESKVLIIDYDYAINYDNYSRYYGIFLKNLITILTDKLKEKNERIEIITNKTIREKLLTYFRQLSVGKNNRTITLPFSFTSLAEYLAVDRSAMNRELKHLKEEGLIEVKGKQIKLLFYIN